MSASVPGQWIVPAWPAPGRVRALITTRDGGVSTGPFGAGTGGGMNVGLHSGDVEHDVLANRARLRRLLPGEPRWLDQVHGARVAWIDREADPAPADAAVSTRAGQVCVVTVADCLPVLLTDRAGDVVGAAHAGWRGLAAGVIQNTVAAMRLALGRGDAALMAYLGPAIGPRWFEVGAEVLLAMRQRLPRCNEAFSPLREGKYLCDLAALARQALGEVGIDEVYGGDDCTYSDAARFYSFRRDRVTGRHAALIWRQP